ncbi:calcineurin-like phosphoesterase domain-containing protein [Ditylenchus destructor]|uniref:Purple acid phosphatase n=1 Tax=Ditylenchus destructor TaxID=166010 RepID=A0AAD4NDI6_9BILA|nr:calcineurin-like phosphoesterase domain-containing protein [Ditylenchus destructor]
MENLLPTKRYQYKVGLKGYWSDWYTFKSLPSAGSKEPFRVAVYGDLAVGGILTEYLIKGAKEQAFDLIIHAGDLAYDFAQNGTGSKYMNQLQEAFARVPYMIAIGNHEWYGDHTYVNMRKRFRQVALYLAA